MKVSAVIVAKNAKDTICYTLNSLRKQTRRPHEVLVIIPSANDNTLKALKEYSEVRIIISGQSARGFQRAVGARYATGDIITFIDSDCVANPKWLEALEDLYSKREDIMAQGGTIIEIENLNQNPQRNIELKNSFPKRIKFLPTANFSFRRGVINIIGNFNEKLNEGEDLDFCIRLLKNRISIVLNPKAIVYHSAKTAKLSIKRSVSYGKSRAIVFLMYKRYLFSAALVAIIHIFLILASIFMLIIHRYDLLLTTMGASLIHQFYKFRHDHFIHKQKVSTIKTFVVSVVSSYILYVSFVIYLLYYLVRWFDQQRLNCTF